MTEQTYTFTITRDVTESATVSVRAESLAAAQEKALTSTPDVLWVLDEGNFPQKPYLPDPDDYMVGEPAPDL